MRKWVRTSAKTALLTAGFVALGSGISFADADEIETSGNGSVLGGNQAVVDANVPVNISGNAVGAIVGIAGASAEDTGAAVIHQRGGGEEEMETSGNGSVLSGNQLDVDADVPLNACGNAVGAVVGIAGAYCEDSGTLVYQSGEEEMETSGNGSVLSGNQADVDVDLPVNVTGNAISAVGGITGAASEDTGAAVIHQKAGDDEEEMETSGNGSVLGGNQLDVDADVPVNVCGNAIGAVVGIAGAYCEDSGAVVIEDGHHHDHDKDWDKGGDHGYGERAHQGGPTDPLGARELLGVNDMPGHRQHQSGATDLLGGVTDLANVTEVQKGELSAAPVVHQRGGDEEMETSGNGSVGGGNQLDVDADVPVNVCGNAVGAVVGIAGAYCEDSGAVVYQSGDEEMETSGNGSVLGGNQADVDADVPVNVTGNAISAVGGITGAASEDTGAAVIHQKAGSETPLELSGMPLLGQSDPVDEPAGDSESAPEGEPAAEPASDLTGGLLGNLTGGLTGGLL